MAEIFKGKLLGLGGFERPMAVKQILPQYASDPDFIEMFIDEAKIAVNLQHGNIVGVHELGRIGEIYFIAMEYVHGHNLTEIISAASRRALPLSVDHAVLIGIEICKGLDYAHRRSDQQGRPLGVVHRDLSPGNVMVSFDGAVKITDFGIAKARHKLGKTAVGAVKGTYGYMSPEQLAGYPVDNRTDIFSTGILLFELLTGQQLFPGSTDLEAVERARQARVTPPSLVSDRVPPGLDMIVLRALEREMDDRYPDANAMQLALSRFLFTSGRGASSTTLGAYMRELFPAEDEHETRAAATSVEAPERSPAQAAAPPDGRAGGRGLSPTGTQSYALRAELVQASAAAGESPGAHGTVRAVVAVKGARAEETLALPSLADARVGALGVAPTAAQLAPAAAFAAALVSAEREAAGGGPGAPAVGGIAPAVGGVASWPEREPAEGGEASRRRRTASFTPSELPAAQGGRRLGAAPGRGEWAGPEGGAAPAGTDAHPLPTAAPRSEGPRPPRSDASVMALLMQPVATSKPAVAAPASVTFASSEFSADSPSASWNSLPFPPPEATAEPAAAFAPLGGGGHAGESPLARRNLLSATMQLFVRDFGEIDSDAVGRAQAARASHVVKLTLLSWVLIGLIVATAVSFLVYRKTRLTQSDLDDGTALLSPDDLRGSGAAGRPAPTAPRRGTIAVSVDPADAVVLLHVGDTPATVGNLDLGRPHLLRLEREGYAAVERTLSPAELAAAQRVEVALQPTGAGAEQATTVGAFPEGASVGRRATVTVSSDPPGATVWLAVGRGGAELSDVPVARYYFKVMRSGYEVAFVSLSEAQFDETSGVAREAVSLARLEAPVAPATPPAAPTPIPTPVVRKPSRRSQPPARARAATRRPPRARREPAPQDHFAQLGRLNPVTGDRET
ncbi:MAG: protein kinase [Proteobacteria bacterium]|nr:protein kinase [Pseudomonadota bacterium]